MAWWESLRLKYKAACPEVPLPSSPAAMPPSPRGRLLVVAGRFLVAFDALVLSATACVLSVKAGRLCQLPPGRSLWRARKLCGITIRRPLGGAGCERSEQTEGVLGLTACTFLSCIPTSPRHTEFTYSATFTCQTIVFYWKVLYTYPVQCKYCLPKYPYI